MKKISLSDLTTMLHRKPSKLLSKIHRILSCHCDLLFKNICFTFVFKKIQIFLVFAEKMIAFVLFSNICLWNEKFSDVDVNGKGEGSVRCFGPTPTDVLWWHARCEPDMCRNLENDRNDIAFVPFHVRFYPMTSGNRSTLYRSAF